MAHYAHSLDGRPEEEWETMQQHEDRVAKRCREFLKRINPTLGDWGEVLGRWHDLGKYSKAFQVYIRQSNDPDATSETRRGRVDHATAGAQHSHAVLPPGIRDLIAYAIAGHHSGLADRVSASGQKSSGLDDRLNKNIEDWSGAPNELLAPPILTLPQQVLSNESTERCGFQLSLLCRMLFSALCDADFLATEQFMSPEVTTSRSSRHLASIDQLKDQLDTYLTRFDTPTKTDVNMCRDEVRAAARTAGHHAQGLYSFTVPTGGGKTLSSLAFALDHAKKHGLQRVIYAIPFTSIIEQTADQFRDVFQPLGTDSILEHHSNLDPEQESRVARLAAQNWDAPLVVTTNVQFFESLFASKTSRCRKLHRIAGSVVIFDEIQTLPVNYLKPCLALIRELVEMFRCTVVLCTATQPAVEFRNDFKIGLRHVHEIIDDPTALYRRMNRVVVENIGKIDDASLGQLIADPPQTLYIVNTRAHASDLYGLLCQQIDDASVFHLSTYMCAAHRTKALCQIKQCLRDELPCRVVSTQLIEAGVDIDFPVVFRSLAGLDSIAQAAGRCNREGHLSTGTLHVFDPQDRRLVGYLKSTAQVAAEVMLLHDDVLSLDAIEHYFRLHYWSKQDQWDEKSIMPMFADPVNLTFQFRTASEQFRFIDDAAQSLFVPWSDKGERLEEEIRSPAFDENIAFRRNVLRRAQRFMVPVYENVFRSMIGTDIELINDNFAVLVNRDLYSDQIGLDITKLGYHEPESLIA